MKTQQLVGLMAMTLLSISFLTVDANAQNRGQRRGRQAGTPMRNAGQTQDGPLTPRERSVLAAMMDEEKLAHDVYVTLARTSNSPTFTTIAQAESQHMSALRNVAVRYGINVPVANNAIGTFADPQVAQLFQTLIAQGSQSPLDAFMVGAKIEEMDIADLESAISVTTHADVQWVFENLQRGSRNHLRAFTNALRNAGGTYKAQHLSQDEYDRIANSPIERGGRAGGNPQAGRGGGQQQRGGNRQNRGRGNPGLGRGNRGR